MREITPQFYKILVGIRFQVKRDANSGYPRTIQTRKSEVLTLTPALEPMLGKFQPLQVRIGQREPMTARTRRPIVPIHRRTIPTASNDARIARSKVAILRHPIDQRSLESGLAAVGPARTAGPDPGAVVCLCTCVAARAIRQHSSGVGWAAMQREIGCSLLARLRHMVAAFRTALILPWRAADVGILVCRSDAEIIQVTVAATARSAGVAARVSWSLVVIARVIRLCDSAGILPTRAERLTATIQAEAAAADLAGTAGGLIGQRHART